jgi:hypothetical protein
MPPRTNRKKLSPGDASNISAAFEQGGMSAAKQMGVVLGYKRSTVYKAVQSQGAIAAHSRR